MKGFTRDAWLRLKIKMWSVNFTERRAWFVNLWTNVRRDLPPEIYVTRQFPLSFREKNQGFPVTLYTKKEVWRFPFSTGDAGVFSNYILTCQPSVSERISINSIIRQDQHQNCNAYATAFVGESYLFCKTGKTVSKFIFLLRTFYTKSLSCLIF